jgi:hypothetical protein
MLRRFVALVRNSAFRGRHAEAEPRKPTGFLVDSQPVAFLFSHVRIKATTPSNLKLPRTSGRLGDRVRAYEHLASEAN